MVKKHPGLAVPLFLLGDEEARAGDARASLALLDEASKTDPSLAIARLARGLLRALNGDTAAACEELNAVVADQFVGTKPW